MVVGLVQVVGQRFAADWHLLASWQIINGHWRPGPIAVVVRTRTDNTSHQVCCWISRVWSFERYDRGFSFVIRGARTDDASGVILILSGSIVGFCVSPVFVLGTREEGSSTGRLSRLIRGRHAGVRPRFGGYGGVEAREAQRVGPKPARMVSTAILLAGPQHTGCAPVRQIAAQ